MSSSSPPFEWLPMPSGISLTGDSFTNDLLRQFDRQRSLLDDDNEDVGKSNDHSSIIVASSIASQSTQESESSDTDSISGDVIHGKSSVYLRNNKMNDGGFHDTPQTEQQIEQPRASTLFNSWTLKRKKKFHQTAQDLFHNEPLSQIAINTTVHVANNNVQTDDSVLQPPVITQYPPKPLKYSPVEPLPHAVDAGTTPPLAESSRRKTLQRFSLPLLRLTAASQPHTNRSVARRRSDSDILNLPPTPSTTHTLFRSISKRWNKLLCTYKKRGVRKKK